MTDQAFTIVVGEIILPTVIGGITLLGIVTILLFVAQFEAQTVLVGISLLLVAWGIGTTILLVIEQQ